MKTFQEMSRQELEEMRGELTARFEEIKAEGLKLDMSRGKPAPEQLDTAMPLLNVLNAESDMQAENGTESVMENCLFVWIGLIGSYFGLLEI